MRTTRAVQDTLVVSLILGAFFLTACGGASNTTTPPPTSSTSQPVSKQASPNSTEQPVAAINSTLAGANDIPDTQTFVTYSSSLGGYSLNVPEGWARTTNAADVNYVFNLDGLQVAITKTTTAPTSDSVRTNQAVTLQQTGKAVRDVKVSDVQLPGGPAVLIVYTSNSDPNPVTGKQVRLENNSYLYYKNGMLATLTLWAPVGADNVDQWARISHSFKWV
ncbi:MAG: lipoprotein [Ktedonobacteraceae bacterium]